MVAEFLTVFGVEVRITEQHRQSAVAHRSGELNVGSALACCKGCELMSEVMEVIILDTRESGGLHPTFLDIDTTECSLAGKNERF